MPVRRGQLYCRPSHRLRAFEKRRIAEIRDPSERTFRLLVDGLKMLHKQRSRYSDLSHAVTRLVGRTHRNPAYERTVLRVRKALEELAPEVFAPLKLPDLVGLPKASAIYRKLAFKYHPDHGAEPQIMTDINELWQAIQADS
jgi:hypothetical protein